MSESQQPKREKTGGRRPGTPNKASGEIKEFLTRVFDRAFTETQTLEIRDKKTGQVLSSREVTFEDMLVERIVTLTIDAKVLNRLLEYRFSAPAKAVTVSGKLTLEQIISGQVPADDESEAA